MDLAWEQYGTPCSPVGLPHAAGMVSSSFGTEQIYSTHVFVYASFS